MNERIRELRIQACKWASENSSPAEYENTADQKFAELIVEDTINIMKQEWYDWNNYPKVENETPRDVGLRVGAKSQTIRLMHMIQKHFGIEK